MKIGLIKVTLPSRYGFRSVPSDIRNLTGNRAMSSSVHAKHRITMASANSIAVSGARDAYQELVE